MKRLSQRACKAGGRIIAPGVSPGICAPVRTEPAKRATDDGRCGSEVDNILCRPFGAGNLFCATYSGLTPGATLCRRLRRLVVALVLTAFFSQMLVAHAQTPASSSSASANSTHNP